MKWLYVVFSLFVASTLADEFCYTDANHFCKELGSEYQKNKKL